MSARRCAFCREEARMASDTPKRRLYECDGCGSVEVISKGQSWWYHGSYLPDGSHIDGDGLRHADGNFGWWVKADARRETV